MIPLVIAQHVLIERHIARLCQDVLRQLNWRVQTPQAIWQDLQSGKLFVYIYFLWKARQALNYDIVMFYKSALLRRCYQRNLAFLTTYSARLFWNTRSYDNLKYTFTFNLVKPCHFAIKKTPQIYSNVITWHRPSVRQFSVWATKFE